MNRTPPKKPTQAQPAGNANERRRVGRVVHDERGTASVEWWNAPEGEERQVLSIEGEKPLSIKNDDTFNPYERTPDSATVPNNKTGKRDLKKLSAWLKLMREMEERKKKGEE